MIIDLLHLSKKGSSSSCLIYQHHAFDIYEGTVEIGDDFENDDRLSFYHIKMLNNLKMEVQISEKDPLFPMLESLISVKQEIELESFVSSFWSYAIKDSNGNIDTTKLWNKIDSFLEHSLENAIKYGKYFSQLKLQEILGLKEKKNADNEIDLEESTPFLLSDIKGAFHSINEVQTSLLNVELIGDVYKDKPDDESHLKVTLHKYNTVFHVLKGENGFEELKRFVFNPNPKNDESLCMVLAKDLFIKKVIQENRIDEFLQIQEKQIHKKGFLSGYNEIKRQLSDFLKI